MKSIKVSSYDSGEFNETIKFELLVCGNVLGNNNKFYCLELQKSKSGQYQLFSNYGRIGKTTVFEVRGPISDFITAEREYNKILKKKKKHTPSKPGYEKVETTEPTVGSSNIRGIKNKISVASDPSFLKKFTDSELKLLMRRLWEENIHNITNMTTMNVSSSGISTPLGPLTLSHLENASLVLKNIKEAYDSNSDELKYHNLKYFSMIPHSFGMIIPSDALIDDDNKYIQEFDLLEQMKSILQVSDKKEEEKEIDLPFEISIIDPIDPEFNWIENSFESSRAICHSNLKDWKIKRIYGVDQKEMTKNYKVIGHSFELFHGSRSSNILSILMNGLMVPPKTAGHVTGRMFGDGIYAAIASTKALNYCTGYWGGGSTKYNQAYMFVVEFSMGETYYPTKPMYNGPPSGFDSIWAKKEKVNLANDEFIVYNTSQARITHLLQIEKRN